MIIRNLQNAETTDRRIVTAQWESTRLLLKSDQMGFSFHITTIYAGEVLTMHYRNHLEAVYCLEGQGSIESLSDHQVYPIAVGTLYALDHHDPHILRAETQMQFVCVFNPPLHGKEVHDHTGSYALDAEPIFS